MYLSAKPEKPIFLLMQQFVLHVQTLAGLAAIQLQSLQVILFQGWEEKVWELYFKQTEVFASELASYDELII